MKLVKNLREAQEKGYVNPQQQSGVVEILKEVNKAIEGFKGLKGIQQGQQNPAQPQPPQNPQYPQMKANENKTEITNKTPLATIEINEQELNNFLSVDAIKLLNNPSINQEIKLREIIEKWEIIKEALKIELKRAIGKIAKAKLEWK